MGLVAARRGDPDGALQLLDEAPRVCRRLPDAYLWGEAYALEALCEVAVDRGAENASRWVTALQDMAARNGMRDLLVRAHLHAARLRTPGATEAAALLTEELGDPAAGQALAVTG